jgi:hypothetical protein
MGNENVTALFDAETYTVYNDNDQLLFTCTCYEDLVMFCYENDYNLSTVTGI